MKKSIGVIFVCSLFAGQVHAESLLEIYDLALENDYSFKSAQSALLASQETTLIAKSLLMPKVNLEGSWQYSKTRTDIESSNPFAVKNELIQERQGPGLSISLTQPILDISALHQYERGKLTEKIAVLQFENAKNSLLMRTANAYLQTLKAGSKLTATQAAEEAYRAQLQSANVKFNIGLARHSDVLEAQARLDAAIADTIIAKNNLSTWFDLVQVLTGKTHTEFATLPANFNAKLPDPMDSKKWAEAASANNIKINLGKLTAQQFYENSRSKATEYLPKVTGSLSFSGSEDDRRFSNAAPDDFLSQGLTASVRLTVPLYSGGNISASAREANYLYLESLDKSKNNVREVAQEVHSIYLSVIANVAAVKARKAAIASSESALVYAKNGYEQGVRSNIDVLNAQNDLYQASQSYAEIVYDYLISGLKLKESSGLLSRKDIEDLNAQLDKANSVYSPALN